MSVCSLFLSHPGLNVDVSFPPWTYHGVSLLAHGISMSLNLKDKKKVLNSLRTQNDPQVLSNLSFSKNKVIYYENVMNRRSLQNALEDAEHSTKFHSVYSPGNTYHGIPSHTGLPSHTRRSSVYQTGYALRTK